MIVHGRGTFAHEGALDRLPVVRAVTIHVPSGAAAAISLSFERDRRAFGVVSRKAAKSPLKHCVHHGLQRLVDLRLAGWLSALAGKTRSEDHAPRRSSFAGFFHKRGEVRQIRRRLVHAHHRSQRTALAGKKAIALPWRGALGEFGRREHEKQAVGLGLLKGGIDKLSKRIGHSQIAQALPGRL